MIERKNKLSEIAIKQAIKLSKIYSLTSARRIMQQANLPNHVIERVLNEPNKTRGTDLSDEVKF